MARVANTIGRALKQEMQPMISHTTCSIDRATAPREEKLIGADRWLSLAAAPVFAIMALATSILRGDPTYMICAAEHGWLLGGMVPMYLLMSAFHSTPWLKLISNQSRRSHSEPVSAAYLGLSDTNRAECGHSLVTEKLDDCCGSRGGHSHPIGSRFH
jgi:hypothetical protein